MQFSLRASSAMGVGCDRNKIWHKGSLRGEDDIRMSNMRIMHAYTEKAPHSTMENRTGLT